MWLSELQSPFQLEGGGFLITFCPSPGSCPGSGCLWLGTDHRQTPGVFTDRWPSVSCGEHEAVSGSGLDPASPHPCKELPCYMEPLRAPR